MHVDGTGRGIHDALAPSSPGDLRWTQARETALRSAVDLDSAGDDWSRRESGDTTRPLTRT
eukprot:8743710-Pyramimonas_sp.AAC.1